MSPNVISAPAPLQRRWRTVWALACALAIFLPATGRTETPSAPEILQEMRSFREMGSVLCIAAHPDDENTLLIAYLARGRDYRTGYLSLTRGDGGQNVLGSDFGSKLGVARTQELLAARRLDGGRQFFSRAVDFGFSKDYRETLRIWDKEQVLSDIVRVIRLFRPDVLVTRFSTVPGGTHGHHTASAVLAVEAFQLAGDPKAFPEQLTDLKPWQPKRILWNGFNGRGTAADSVKMEISGQDPVLGISFGELAARSRAMHKTQGFGNYRGGGDGPRTETFQLLAGEPATNDIMDGIDTTWNRVPGGGQIEKGITDIIDQFDPLDIAASLPALFTLRSQLAGLGQGDSVVAEKRALLDHIVQACLGLEVQTVIPQSEVVPGETLKMRHSVVVHSSIPITLVAVSYPAAKDEKTKTIDLRGDQPFYWDSTETLPAITSLTQPYWLREKGTPGMFRVEDPSLIGRPENPPAFKVNYIFEIDGQQLTVADEPVQLITNSAGPATRRLEVISPVSLSFSSDVALFAPGETRPIEIRALAARPDLSGVLRLEAPPGWRIQPRKQSFHLNSPGDRYHLEFMVTAPRHPATAEITAKATIAGVNYRNDRELVNYAHIPRQLLQPPAGMKAISLNLAIRGDTVGYLPGAGDSVAESLEQMGYSVRMLDDADLTLKRLDGLDAVVIGIRAFNVRTNLAEHLPALFDYVKNGGTLIEQYNRPDGLKAKPLAPYELHLSGGRVTDETAPVTFLAPQNPVLNIPNKITEADFAGWVQERGVYFPDQWDEHFTPILSCHDPGEEPLDGELLVARYGGGYIVYTGLDFFRELPAGVPGSFRLFANLVSLGK